MLALCFLLSHLIREFRHLTILVSEGKPEAGNFPSVNSERATYGESLMVGCCCCQGSLTVLCITLFLCCVCSTWTGPAWSPAQSISSVLISIQSLMTENPYHNEPGFEQVKTVGPCAILLRPAISGAIGALSYPRKSFLFFYLG